jgi:1,4-dihydroxy-2-naphthoate octaprenyltransferase
MRNAALATFSLAILFAIPLLMRIGTAYIPLMLLCILAGVCYTGGKRPLGYMGLGDLLVFVFYGPVAVCCTALALLLYLPMQLLILSLAPGFLSCAILCINNLRDADEDRKCGKMTLVARFGKRFGQAQYLCCLLGAAIILFATQGLLPSLLFAALTIKPISIVLKKHAELNAALGMTAFLLTAYTLFLCYAFLWL